MSYLVGAYFVCGVLVGWAGISWYVKLRQARGRLRQPSRTPAGR